MDKKKKSTLESNKDIALMNNGVKPKNLSDITSLKDSAVKNNNAVMTIFCDDGNEKKPSLVQYPSTKYSLSGLIQSIKTELSSESYSILISHFKDFEKYNMSADTLTKEIKNTMKDSTKLYCDLTNFLKTVGFDYYSSLKAFATTICKEESSTNGISVNKEIIEIEESSKKNVESSDKSKRIKSRREREGSDVHNSPLLKPPQPCNINIPIMPIVNHNQPIYFDHYVAPHFQRMPLELYNFNRYALTYRPGLPHESINEAEFIPGINYLRSPLESDLIYPSLNRHYPPPVRDKDVIIVQDNSPRFLGFPQNAPAVLDVNNSLNKLLDGDFINKEEFNQLSTLKDKFKDLNNLLAFFQLYSLKVDNPNLVKKFVKILKRYQSMLEVSSKSIDGNRVAAIQYINDEITKLLSGHPELYDFVVQHLPTTDKTKMNQDQTNRTSTPQSDCLEAISKIEITQPTQNKERATEVIGDEPELLSNLVPERKGCSDKKENKEPKDLREVFSLLEEHLPAGVYDNFLKLCILYNNGIITEEEYKKILEEKLASKDDRFTFLIEKVKSLEPTNLLKSMNDNSFGTEGNVMSSSSLNKDFRKPAIKSKNLRETRQLENSRPVTRNFGELIGTSYVTKLNSEIPTISEYHDVLNTCCILQPKIHIEDKSQQTIRQKNVSYEDLMRFEEERYEFDTIMELNSYALGYLSKYFYNPIKKLTSERVFKGRKRNLITSALCNVYGEEGITLLHSLATYPYDTLAVIIPRLESKQAEWKRIKDSYADDWKRGVNKHFLKAHDYQGQSIKLADSRSVKPKSLINDFKNDPNRISDAYPSIELDLSSNTLNIPYTNFVVFSQVLSVLKVRISKLENVEETELVRVLETFAWRIFSTNAYNQNPGGIVFYGDEDVYFFCRIFCLLCFRWNMMLDFCMKSMQAYTTISNRNGEQCIMHPYLLTNMSQLGLCDFKGGYSVSDYTCFFKKTVNALMDGSMDQDRYEDTCRYIFGMESYVLFSIDRLVNECVKCICNLSSVERIDAVFTIASSEETTYNDKLLKSYLFNFHSTLINEDEIIIKVEQPPNDEKRKELLLSHKKDYSRSDFYCALQLSELRPNQCVHYTSNCVAEFEYETFTENRLFLLRNLRRCNLKHNFYIKEMNRSSVNVNSAVLYVYNQESLIESSLRYSKASNRSIEKCLNLSDLL